MTDPSVEEGARQRDKSEIIRGLLDHVEKELRVIRQLIFEQQWSGRVEPVSTAPALHEDEQRIIEGIFDGEQMLGSDGRRYPVPPNYASKSKLVTGDVMKLTIARDGSFIYKQIGPVERQKLIGRLEEKGGRYLVVLDDGRSFDVLSASITYFRAHPGDQLTIVVPKAGEANWAAVENVIQEEHVVRLRPVGE